MKQTKTIIPLMAVAMTACQSEKPAENTTPTQNQQTETAKPNVLLIMTDDQGYGDVGFHNNPVVKTPTLDSLATVSTRFHQFYVSPVCAPTRASLMTGRYNLRTGVYDTYNGGSLMHTNEVTMAEVFKKAGYTTAITGKWHLGDNHPMRPQDQGFDQVLIHRGGGLAQPSDFVENQKRKDSCYFDPVLEQNGQKTKAKGYCTDVFTNKAIDFMQKSQKPFFCYLSLNAPHTPLQVPQQYYDLYKNWHPDSLGLPHGQKMSEADVERARKVYGMVTNLDENLRRVFAMLRATGKLKNTIVIFMTDNGPQHYRYNAGLKKRKSSVFEGGIRVPSYWSWQGRIPSNTTIKTVGAHIDVLPTLAEACALKLPNNVTIDGKSLWPAITGKTKNKLYKDRSLYWTWMRGLPQAFKNTAIRKGAYKLVGQTQNHSDSLIFHLFDLEKDPKETNNIAQSNPQLVEQLKDTFNLWLDEMLASPNINNCYISLGDSAEPTTVLNRNDWFGAGGRNWGDDRVWGHYKVDVKETGLYTFKIWLKKGLPREGRFHIKTNNSHHVYEARNIGQEYYTLKNVKLIKGKTDLQAYFRTWNDIYGPNLIYVTKQ